MNKCWCDDAEVASVRSLNSGNSSISSPHSYSSLDSDLDIHRNGIVDDNDDDSRESDDTAKILNGNGYYHHGSVDNGSIDIPILSDSSEVVHSDASNEGLSIDETPSNINCNNKNIKTFFKRSDFSDSENSDLDDLNETTRVKNNNKCHRTLLEPIDNRNSHHRIFNGTLVNNANNNNHHHHMIVTKHNGTTNLNRSIRRKSNDDDQSIVHKSKPITKRRKTYHADTENDNLISNRLETNNNTINDKDENNLDDHNEDSLSVETDEELARRLQQEEYQAARPARRRVAIVAYDRLHEQLSKLKKDPLIDEIMLQQQQQQQASTTATATSRIKRRHSSTNDQDDHNNNDQSKNGIFDCMKNKGNG